MRQKTTHLVDKARQYGQWQSRELICTLMDIGLAYRKKFSSNQYMGLIILIENLIMLHANIKGDDQSPLPCRLIITIAVCSLVSIIDSDHATRKIQ